MRRLLTILCLLGTLALLAITGAGMVGMEIPALDALNHFRPLYVAAALALMVIIPATRTVALRGAMAAALICVTIAQTVFIAPEFTAAYDPVATRPAKPGPGTKIKLIDFNMWGNNKNLDQVAKLVLREDPDFVILQEFWRGHRELLWKLRRRYPHVISCANWRGCHLALLSKHRPLSREVRGSGRTYQGRQWHVPVIAARFRVARRTAPVTVIATHLVWPLPAHIQHRQFAELGDYVARYKSERLVLAGDFNSTPWSHALARFERRVGLRRLTRGQWSWPSKVRYPNMSPLRVPFLPIDHVFAGSDVEAIRIRRGPASGSDHYPIIAELALAKKKRLASKRR